ncbi:MAG: Uma2 family endonuclease [Caldilineae bacterium]|nr:MAG: Uma2 family endonuclease [Caldilineae bacterium]
MLKTTLPQPQTKPWPAQGHWTYDDYLRLPDDGRRYEIIEGVLYMVNAPSFEHQFAVAEIFGELRNFVKKNRLGVVLTAPFEVHLSETTRPVQPDVLFIRAENHPQPDAPFFEGAPDLVVEVLSPATTRTDRFIKFNAYEKAGIPEYWIVNPKTRSVEVFTLSEGGEYALKGEYTADETVESEVLAGLKIPADSLFAPPAQS